MAKVGIENSEFTGLGNEVLLATVTGMDWTQPTSQEWTLLSSGDPGYKRLSRFFIRITAKTGTPMDDASGLSIGTNSPDWDNWASSLMPSGLTEIDKIKVFEISTFSTKDIITPTDTIKLELDMGDSMAATLTATCYLYGYKWTS